MELRPVTRTVKTPAENFTGDVYLNPVFNDDDASLVVGLVRFTPRRPHQLALARQWAVPRLAMIRMS